MGCRKVWLVTSERGRVDSVFYCKHRAESYAQEVMKQIEGIKYHVIHSYLWDKE